jgi:predicted dehydrogenase
MTHDKLLRVAVVGTGIGRSHLAGYRALPEMFEIAAVCDVDRDRGAAVAAEFGVSRVVTSLDELCREANLDVIDL